MSRFYPHSEYAEDQPLSRTILATHVLARGFQIGAGLGVGVGLASHAGALYKDRTAHVRPPKGADVGAATMDQTSRAARRPFAPTLLRSAGAGSVFGLALLSVGLVVQMHGKEDIEWRDRSWRLLENKGQMELDTWQALGAFSGLGGALSPSVALKYGGRNVLGLSGVVGGAALGSLGGLFGYLAYRYGYKRGRWED
ncbi:hypothetical protein BDW22DRAFT_1364374 [Trametopsis cervina]|nr:hypothetical protein BDW22DRAFT_1364374 [Trametopsis cervina]